ncbi:hypothetical protein BV121_465 [Haemophilus influenzae]|nr:hypothetical protein BV121_465 [Haemophilus influenzae]AVJ00936.1 hypothetical protein BV122_466 [Haemophilus influenzae]
MGLMMIFRFELHHKPLTNSGFFIALNPARLSELFITPKK